MVTKMDHNGSQIKIKIKIELSFFFCPFSLKESLQGFSLLKTFFVPFLPLNGSLVVQN